MTAGIDCTACRNCDFILVHLLRKKLPSPSQVACRKHKEHTGAWNVKNFRRTSCEVIVKTKDCDFQGETQNSGGQMPTVGNQRSARNGSHPRGLQGEYLNPQVTGGSFQVGTSEYLCSENHSVYKCLKHHFTDACKGRVFELHLCYKCLKVGH